jgi:dipeptidyl aminopeptidase/acylaminoacyl peptidase
MRSHLARLQELSRSSFAALAGVALLTSAAAAQYTQFGQNQVQYKRFEWRVKKTEHFDVHYYKGMEQGAGIAARMAERSYARLSRLMGYQFKERKPIIVFASRGDFAQNNVTGDLGEQTGGVTDMMHERNMFFFGQDLAEVEHVMTHEMVHQFQYDIQFRGRPAGGAAMVQGNQLPQWFAEGMAEYLSIGPDHPATDAMIRDAALNGNLPSVQQMTDQPDRWFVYRFGESFWRYVGQRWGDEIIGEIMLSTPSLGLERAFKRHTGMDLDDLSDDWRDANQTTYLPGIAALERPRKVAQPLLNARKTGGIIPVYVAPALSSDGRQIAYISTGSLLRAEVFLDLYLADATNGKRLKRLTNSVLNPETEELRVIYSQSAFSPDGRLLAYTGYREGKDVVFVLDVKTREVLHRLDTGLEGMVGPSWSPDGKRMVFSGSKNGFSNIYMIDADGRNLRQLTTGLYAGLQPSWSPDGRKVAFVSDRGSGTNLDLLKFGKWRINVLDLESNSIEVIPGQAGKNLNPSWAPDGKSIAFISDRTGIPQIFLYDFDTKEHYQITKLIGGVQAMTENSPALTWARQADKMAFVYVDNGQYTVWSISNPRQLKKDPYRDAPVAAVVAAAPPPASDSISRRVRESAEAAAAVAALARSAPTPARDSTGGRRQSLYRGPAGLRASGEIPAAGAPGSQSAVSVAALLDSASLALPNESSFKDEPYHATLRAEQVLRPQIAYSQTNFGGGVFGGTGVLLADMLGNRQLLLYGSVNGRIEEAQVAVQYASFANRLNWRAGFEQFPYFLFTSAGTSQVGAGQYIQSQSLVRVIQRDVSFASMWPINRFNRFEMGASFVNYDQAAEYISRGIAIDPVSGGGYATPFYVDSIRGAGSLNYLSPFVAYVSDNALFGSTAPIYGHRYRLMVEPNIGKQGMMIYQADLRRYDALLFSFLTLATRVYGNLRMGPGETIFPPQYLGIPQYIRGYDREYYNSSSGCAPTAASTCIDPLTQLIGSRVLLGNAEIRFPLVRRFQLGVLPIALPPIDGLFFYDAGMAWSEGQSVTLTRPNNYDPNTQRYPLRSFGYGVRMNLFGFAILRWDYAIPRDSFDKKGYWWFSLGPSF